MRTFIEGEERGVKHLEVLLRELLGGELTEELLGIICKAVNEQTQCINMIGLTDVFASASTPGNVALLLYLSLF